MDPSFLKRIPAWVYVLVVLFIPAVTGTLTIVDRLWPDRPEVRIYYEVASGNLPEAPRKALYELGILTSAREGAVVIDDSSSETKTVLEERIEKVLKVLTNVPYRVYEEDGQVLKLRISNTGNRPAKNLIVKFPGEGLLEIKEKGKDRVILSASELSLSMVPPDSTLTATYWGTRVSDLFSEINFSASHDGGKAELISAIQRRDSTNYVITFKGYHLVFGVGPLTVLVLLLLVLFHEWSFKAGYVKGSANSTGKRTRSKRSNR